MTARELLIKLNDLYKKILEHQDMSITSIIPNPTDIITEYNNYITAKFLYNEKLADLEKIDLNSAALSGFNDAVIKVKKDKTCISNVVKPQKGSGKKNNLLVRQDAGGFWSSFFSSSDNSFQERSIEEKIELLEQQQKVLEETPLKSMNINLKKEYEKYVAAIKKYKKTLITASKSSDVGGTNVLELINEYIETIHKLQQNDCKSKSYAAEFPLVDLALKIKETTDKSKLKTAQISSVSPNIKKYMDEIKDLKKKIKDGETEAIALKSKISKYGIDTMRKSAVSSALKVGKIKDLLSSSKQGRKLYYLDQGRYYDNETGIIAPTNVLLPGQSQMQLQMQPQMQPQSQSQMQMQMQTQPQSQSQTQMHMQPSASGSTPSSSGWTQVNSYPTAYSGITIDTVLQIQAGTQKTEGWEEILTYLKQIDQTKLPETLRTALDSKYLTTDFFKEITRLGVTPYAKDKMLIAALSNDGTIKPSDIKTRLNIGQNPQNKQGQQTQTVVAGQIPATAPMDNQSKYIAYKAEWNSNTYPKKSNQIEASILKFVTDHPDFFTRREPKGPGSAFKDYFNIKSGIRGVTHN